MNRPGRVRELFDEAVARPPGERDDFLRSAVPDDSELRAEVASLLAAHDAPDDLFDRPLAERFGGPAPAASLIGRELGAYRITREIGRGGMGTVYEAVRADDQFAKRVAIKMLRSGIDSGTALRRFRREQEIQAALAHPNIATLLDAGATDEGAPYLVLEYVDGVPLDAYADRHRLPLAARLDLIRQVIQAVQHAHRQLVVHRDLKPSNILVTADGVVKLLDFGISKLLDDTAGHTTTDGSSGFTTAYASPEQLKGEAVSTATDVYSLGTVLFRLLTGRHPFEIDDLTPVAAWKTICEEEPRPPSAVATAAAAAAMGYPGPERLRRALQGELDAIVLMALRKEPGRRYSTADALGEDLLNYLKGLPVQARPDSPGYRLGKLVRRNRLAAAALALAFVAMGSGTAVAWWQAREARASAAAADQERLTAQRVSAFLQSVFSSADASWRGRGAGRGPNASILEVVDAAAGRVDSELGGEPAVAEALEQTLVSIYRSLGQSEKAGAHARELLRYLRARGAGPEDLAQGLTNLSTYHYVAGHLDSSLALAREAYERYGEAGYPESQEFGVALNQLGLVLFAVGRAPEAEPYMARAVALRRKLFGADAVAAIGLNNLGLIRDAQGDIDGAIARFREADEIFLGSPQREYFERGIVLANLAGEMLLKGELAEAERTAREGVGVYQRTVGPDHPNLGITLLRLAQIELASGRPRDALATHRSAVQRFRQFGSTHPDVARSQSYGAEILLALGRLDQAEQSVRLALETRRAVYAPTDWRIAETERVLGRVLAARGKTAEAREYLRRARDNFQATMGPDDPRTRAAAGDLDALPGGADPAS